MRLLLASALCVFLSSSLLAQLQLNGAGATFPYVLYSKWFDVYKKKTGIQFNYQSIGSGGGIKQITDGTVDFGASDGPMTDEQLALARQKRGTDILHIPTTLGAVVIAYNLSLPKPLQLTPDVLADIFLGVIKRWDDRRITAINPGISLPSKPIVVVHRSDGSGTTAIFTDYLCKISNYWKQRYGQGTSVSCLKAHSVRKVTKASQGRSSKPPAASDTLSLPMLSRTTCHMQRSRTTLGIYSPLAE